MTDRQFPAVTVYTNPGCRPCKRVLAKLRGAEIDFHEVDLSLPEHEDARSYVQNVLGASSVPVIVSDVHDPIIGYDPTKLKSLIAALALT